MAQSKATTTYQFGEFTLGINPTRLVLEGKEIELRAQALRLLALLVEHHGQLVSHSQIRKHLWGDLHVDFANGIHVCVRQIRQVLGDDGERPKFIETIPRRGYRFIAVVTDSLERKTPRQHRMTLSFLTVLVVLAVAAITVAPRIAPDRFLADQEKAANPQSISRDPFIAARKLLETGDVQRMPESRRLFNLAIEADSEFAPAYVGVAQTYELEGEFDAAEGFVLQAIEIDRTYADAYVRLASIQRRARWNWQGAEENLLLALQIAPFNIEAIQALSTVYLLTGRQELALNLVSTALDAEPHSADLMMINGITRYRTRDYVGAQSHCGDALEIRPNFLGALECQYKAALGTKQAEVARRAAVSLADAISPGTELALAGFSAPEAVNAFEQWRLHRLEEDFKVGSTSPLDLAFSAIVLRRFDEASYYVLQGYDERWPDLPEALLDPIYIPIRHTGEFLEMTDAIGVLLPGENPDGKSQALR